MFNFLGAAAAPTASVVYAAHASRTGGRATSLPAAVAAEQSFFASLPAATRREAAEAVAADVAGVYIGVAAPQADRTKFAQTILARWAKGLGPVNSAALLISRGVLLAQGINPATRVKPTADGAETSLDWAVAVRVVEPELLKPGATAAGAAKALTDSLGEAEQLVRGVLERALTMPAVVPGAPVSGSKPWGKVGVALAALAAFAWFRRRKRHGRR